MAGVCCQPGTYPSGSTCLHCGCSAYSNSSQCDQSGQCPCPPGFQGLRCDECSHMHHNLSAGCPPCTCDMPECNCIQCVCSSWSPMCSADLVNYSEAVITTDFASTCTATASSLECMGGWTFVSVSGLPLPALLRSASPCLLLLFCTSFLPSMPHPLLILPLPLFPFSANFPSDFTSVSYNAL